MTAAGSFASFAVLVDLLLLQGSYPPLLLTLRADSPFQTAYAQTYNGSRCPSVILQCRSFGRLQYFTKENHGTLEILSDEDGLQ